MPATRTCSGAQPVYLSHHLLAYFWMFRRDCARFEFALDASRQLPLGAARWPA
jgi:argininosuccinate lyase